MPTLIPAALLLHVEHTARQIAGRRRWIDERDLVQDGLVGCLTALRRYDGRTKLSTFLRHRARGSMLDSLRRINFRGKVRWIPMSATLSATLRSGTPSPDGHVLAKELRECLDELPWKEAYVLERLFFADATYQEVGNELGVTKARILQIRQAGLNRLKIFFSPP